MNKLIFSGDFGLIEQELTAILKQNQDKEIVHFEYKDSLLDIVNDINQVSLFSNDKLYVIHNSIFLNTLDEFKKEQDNLEIIKNQTDIIFIDNVEKISTASLVKKYLEGFEIINPKSLTAKTINSYISKIAKQIGLNLTFSQIESIGFKLIPNASIINMELSKLVNYKTINDEIINNVISNYDDANVFKLVEFMFNKQIDQLLVLYDQLIDSKMDPVAIIQMISSQIYRLYLIKQMLDEHKSIDSISYELGIHNFVVSNSVQLIKKYDLNKLQYILNTLYLLDIKIKENFVDKVLALKIFIISL